MNHVLETEDVEWFSNCNGLDFTECLLIAGDGGTYSGCYWKYTLIGYSCHMIKKLGTPPVNVYFMHLAKITCSDAVPDGALTAVNLADETGRGLILPMLARQIDILPKNCGKKTLTPYTPGDMIKVFTL